MFYSETVKIKIKKNEREFYKMIFIKTNLNKKRNKIWFWFKWNEGKINKNIKRERIGMENNLFFYYY